jgi:hypothetical protein
MARGHPKGLISFPDDYRVFDIEAEARKRLFARRLLTLKEDGCVNVSLLDLFNLPYLCLTVAGEDEARIYCSWFSRTGLWYRDRISHHWVVPIVTFIAGILGTLFVQWLGKNWL